MEKSFQEYTDLASRNEDLKSEERVLNAALDNLRVIKDLLIQNEKGFCLTDQSLRASCNGNNNIRDSLRKRCFSIIDHLMHYKCVIECIAGDIFVMANNLIDEEEYIHLSLTFRDAELAILNAIKVNQQRNEIYAQMHDEEAQSYLSEIEQKWRTEHQEHRKLISKLIINQSQFLIDKTTRNLEQQQMILNNRYQTINHLIKLSYHHNDIET